MDFRIHGGLTCNNFLMLPGKIDPPASDVITETKIARNVILRTPFMSSPMDTITETDIAISLALLDYIRVVHPSPPSLEPDALYPPETGSLGAKTCYDHVPCYCTSRRYTNRSQPNPPCLQKGETSHRRRTGSSHFLLENQNYPLASKDRSEQLYAATAVDTRPSDKARLGFLVQAGLDMIILDQLQFSDRHD
ncbi:IMP dehydrogenase/GMP reductase [Suillus tomentosus]|nr:IMP dehydrogenase/GMP reductase [Suillus tomentosus]